MRRLAPSILLALPALRLAVAGLFHPHHLTYDTSYRWYALHLPGLLVFPLVGVALAVLVADAGRPAGLGGPGDGVRLRDLLHRARRDQRVAAGYVTHRSGRGCRDPRRSACCSGSARRSGEIGSWALLACCALLVVDQVLRYGAPALVGLVLLPGAWLVHIGHIFAPERCARDGAARPGHGLAGLCGRDTTGKFEIRGNLRGPQRVIVSDRRPQCGSAGASRASEDGAELWRS